MDDLHSRIRTSVTSRLETARAADTGAPWNWWRWAADKGFAADAALIRDCEPRTVIARCEALLRVLDRHPHRRFATAPGHWPGHWKAELREAFPGTDKPYVGCEVCDWNTDYEEFQPDWWCETIRDLAAGEGIEVTG